MKIETMVARIEKKTQKKFPHPVDNYDLFNFIEECFKEEVKKLDLPIYVIGRNNRIEIVLEWKYTRGNDDLRSKYYVIEVRMRRNQFKQVSRRLKEVEYTLNSLVYYCPEDVETFEDFVKPALANVKALEEEHNKIEEDFRSSLQDCGVSFRQFYVLYKRFINLPDEVENIFEEELPEDLD